MIVNNLPKKFRQLGLSKPRFFNSAYPESSFFLNRISKFFLGSIQPLFAQRLYFNLGFLDDFGISQSIRTGAHLCF